MWWLLAQGPGPARHRSGMQSIGAALRRPSAVRTVPSWVGAHRSKNSVIPERHATRYCALRRRNVLVRTERRPGGAASATGAALPCCPWPPSPPSSSTASTTGPGRTEGADPRILSGARRSARLQTYLDQHSTAASHARGDWSRWTRPSMENYW